MSLFDEDNVEETTDATIYQSPTFEEDVRIHVDEAIGSASIAPSGRDVVLASQHGLHIIDLDSPFAPPRHLRHETAWMPADVQWSPFAVRYYWVASTSNQRALVWNLELSTPQAPIEHVLHAHSRAITDINFSAHHPDVLATCAVDSFVHCWDLRTPAKPAISFSDWYAGATQVKWNRVDPHVIASSHDKFLRIWDDRKGATPLTTIEAHSTKIYGVDWNRTDASKIITCSLDRTIKVWDYVTSDVHPERIIRTPFPVWRARHTPFGCGLLAMPQRGDPKLHLYDRRIDENTPWDADVEPAHSFKGHQGHVKEFLWRARGGIDGGVDNRDFQLVSWGSDQELILHRMREKHLKPVGFEKGMPLDQPWELTRRGSPYRTFRDQLRSTLTMPPPPTPGRTSSLEDTQAILEGRGSPGMRRAPLPMSRDWAHGASPVTSAGMQTKNGKTQNTNLISWMKGVKFGKRGKNNRQKLRSMDPAELKSAAFRRQGESLKDEIVQVSETFRKVTFEEIDMSARRARVSMYGPWTRDGKRAFIQLHLQFPRTYPEAATPRFQFERLSSVPHARLQVLEKDLNTIARAHVQHGLGCLEGVLSYLLGDTDLKQSTQWLDPEGLNDYDKVDSSSDDEDNIGDFAITQSQARETDGTAGTGFLGTNANVPLPKACGAIWAPDGRLVCFFPPRSDPPSLFDKVGLRDDSPRSDGIFEGLGRFDLDPGEALTATAKDESLVDVSESESSSMSTSSSESDDGVEFPGLHPPKAWHGAPIRLRKNKTNSTNGSIKLSTGLGGSRSSSGQKTVVSIHNVDELLPARRDLASDYMICGDATLVCAHNAAVASRHGQHGLADVWELSRLLLSSEVPLTQLQLPPHHESVFVLARRALVHIKKKNQGLDLSFDEPEAVINPLYTCGVKWGTHPFGGSWLIASIFEHLERSADVQMLAMLSCIFADPQIEETPQQDHIPARKGSWPSMESSDLVPNYLPSGEVAISMQKPFISISMSSGRLRNSTSAYGSFPSSEGTRDARDNALSEPTTPFSTGSTPPFNLSRSSSHRVGALQSISASPENRGPNQASAASSFAASVWSRPFQLSQSPPQRSRLSGEENLPGSVSSSVGGGVTWGPTTVHGSNATMRRSYLAQEIAEDLSDGSETDEDEPRTPSDTGVKVTLKNQVLFDDEAHASIPFLSAEVQSAGCYAAYREAYAHILDIWGLTIQANEILKFNAAFYQSESSSTNRRSFDDAASQTTLTIGKSEPAPNEPVSTKQGLALTRVCAKCGRPSAATSLAADAVRCSRCNSSMRLLSCSVCQEPVVGLHKACFKCGHVSHMHCLHAVLADRVEARENEDLNVLDTEDCEAGCGCQCDVLAQTK